MVLSCRAGGLAVINYGNRNLLDGIVVAENAAVANRSFDFSLPESTGRLTLKRNRAISRPEAIGFRSPDQAGDGGNISETASLPLIELADQFQGLLPTPAILAKALRAVDSGRMGPDEIQHLFENLSAPDGRGPKAK